MYPKYYPKEAEGVQQGVKPRMIPKKVPPGIFKILPKGYRGTARGEAKSYSKWGAFKGCPKMVQTTGIWPKGCMGYRKGCS